MSDLKIPEGFGERVLPVEIRKDSVITTLQEIEVGSDKPTGPLRAAQEYHAPHAPSIIESLKPIEVPKK